MSRKCRNRRCNNKNIAIIAGIAFRNFGNDGNCAGPLILVDPIRREIDSAELTRFAQVARRLVGISGRMGILITSDQRLQRLNRRFRKKNKPTDVLSFCHPDQPGGDIAISAELASENASRYGHEMSHELKILILHGMLHLAGYDHERDNGEMAAKETALRKRLGLPTALIERAGNIHPGEAKTQKNAKKRNSLGKAKPE